MARNLEEVWQAYRREMIRETERFIDYGLSHPDEIIEIPSKPVGEDAFPREVAYWFYSIVLRDPDKDTTATARWRAKLKGGARWIRRGLWPRVTGKS